MRVWLAKTADEIERFSAELEGGPGIFDHGDIERIAGHTDVGVAFDSAAHAFEDDEVGIGGGVVEFDGDV